MNRFSISRPYGQWYATYHSRTTPGIRIWPWGVSLPALTTNFRKRKKRHSAPLRRLVSPYILRRLKTDKSIISDLPEKTEMKVFCGLTLTAASHVIHFDRWWNPAVENQATNRAFRIGQKRNVLVHKFITSGTLEEKIDAPHLPPSIAPFP